MEDIIGRKYGKLTVIEKLYEDYVSPGGVRSHRYLCRCDCGNELIKLKSNLKENSSCYKGLCAVRNNLIGQRFGRLVVVGLDNHKTNSRQSRWICECDCGNTVVVTHNNLINGRTNSCGCLQKELAKKRYVLDLTGMRFGKLFVLGRSKDSYISPSGERRVCWDCICDCGRKISVRSTNIVNGHSTHCGCSPVHSKGEKRIHEYLTSKGVLYDTEYTFPDLKNTNGRKVRFDFALLDPDGKLLSLVEYQGRQHFSEIESGKFGRLQRDVTDKLKKDYCVSNNIKLFEITYLENVDNRLDEILQTSYYANAVPSLENEEGVTTISQEST